VSNQAMKARMGYVGSVPGLKAATPGRDSDSWFTPAMYIEAARRVLGAIDLDPFSSAAANETVRATRYFTAADNALTCGWALLPTNVPQNVWMNPPYTAALIKPAITRLKAECRAGTVGAGIVLVNNATDTLWFHELLSFASAVCFTRGRIAFKNVDGKRISSNTRGQAFVLVGDHADRGRFMSEFGQFGRVLAVGAV
jgi:phage N-6-adenine-methyltransferase